LSRGITAVPINRGGQKVNCGAARPRNLSIELDFAKNYRRENAEN